ncbi:hypothetical protein HDV02_000118 [Globomyces sp. JEL0801]|nr:hypothetical protein HDV02_000118 [Globomyces sp. JEL0801]
MEGNPAVAYSFPGVLHFLQVEWRRFERERNEWEIERSELKTRVALLEGERKAIDNMKTDLVRRVKMLEYALRQERSKVSKDATVPETVEKDLNEIIKPPGGLMNYSKGFGHSRSREILKSYLKEADTLLASATVHRKSDRTNLDESFIQSVDQNSAIPTETLIKMPITLDSGSAQGVSKPRTSIPGQGLKPGQILIRKPDSENSKYSFKQPEGMQDALNLPSPSSQTEIGNLPTNFGNLPGNFESMNSSTIKADKSKKAKKISSKTKLSTKKEKPPHPSMSTSFTESFQDPLMSPVEITPSELIESPLFRQTNKIPNRDTDAANSIITGSPKASSYGQFNSLRSHLDAVRSLSFHPKTFGLLSGSEDHTVKLWKLKTDQLETNHDPIFTFRGHSGPVTSVEFSALEDICFSGSADTSIRVWRLPAFDISPYSNHVSAQCIHTLVGHSDIVWDIAAHSTSPRLLSASADGTVKLWNVSNESSALVSTLWYNGLGKSNTNDNQIPTSMAWVSEKTMAASYRNSAIQMFDLTVGKMVLNFENNMINPQINKIRAHPTLPLIITADEDGDIRYFDHNTGKCVGQFKAHHGSGVSSVRISDDGKILASGGHNGTVKLWDIESHACLQEFKPKPSIGISYEGVWDVAISKNHEIIASGTSSSLINIYKKNV